MRVVAIMGASIWARPQSIGIRCGSGACARPPSRWPETGSPCSDKRHVSACILRFLRSPCVFLFRWPPSSYNLYVSVGGSQGSPAIYHRALLKTRPENCMREWSSVRTVVSYQPTARRGPQSWCTASLLSCRDPKCVAPTCGRAGFQPTPLAPSRRSAHGRDSTLVLTGPSASELPVHLGLPQWRCSEVGYCCELRLPRELEQGSPDQRV